MTCQWDTITLRPFVATDLWWRNIWDCTWLIPTGWRPCRATWWGPVEYVGRIRYDCIRPEWYNEEAFVFEEMG